MYLYIKMDSFEFFDNKEFTKKWKGKAGVYIIENPLFTRFVGFPVYIRSDMPDIRSTRE